MQDEKVILEPILEESTKFKNFYEKERPRAGSITWIKDSVMPAEDVVAYAVPLKGEIHYKNCLPSSDCAYVFAHEIMHLVRCRENCCLELRCKHPSFYIFISKLLSLLEDPIVDLYLQKNYSFDLRNPYKTAMDYCRKTFERETTDNLSRLLSGIDLANYMLCWNLIDNNATAKDEWFDYLRWYRELRPNSYKIADEIIHIIWIHGGAHGAETVEKQEKVVSRMIDLYQLQNVVFLCRS